MAARTSNGTGGGNWSAGASWAGGVAPVGGDTVTILAGDTITVNTTGCECGIADNATSLQLSGTLRFSRVANSDLTIRGTAVYMDGSMLDIGTAASPIPAGFTAKLILGKNDTTQFRDNWWAASNFINTGGATAYGVLRARVVTLIGAVAAGSNVVCPVSDVTGWQIGDVIVFPQTSNNAVYETEIATVTAIAGLNVTVNTLAYAHMANCKVGNLSSNVIVQGFDPSRPASMLLSVGTLPDNAVDFENVAFIDMGQDTNGLGGFMVTGSNSVPSQNAPAILKNCGFLRTSGAFGDGCMAGGYQTIRRPFVVDTCAMYAPTNTSAFGVWFGGSNLNQATAKNCLIATPNSFGGGQHGQTISGCFCSVNGDAMFSYAYGGNKVTVLNCILSGRGMGVTYGDGMSGPMIFDGCDLGVTFGFYENFGDHFMRGVPVNALVNVIVKDSKVTAGFGNPTSNPNTDVLNMNPLSQFIYSSKNNDPTQHEFWGAGGQITRDAGFTFDGSSPAWKFRPINANVPLVRAFQVLAPYSGSSPTLAVVSGRIYRGTGAGPTTVTLSGLGITPSVYTCTLFNQWEQFIVFATQTQGSSGVLDVTISAGFASGTPSVWVANVSAPLAVAADTGKFNFWSLGQPVPLVMSNNVSALDVWNVLTSQLTLAGSAGKRLVDDLDGTISSISAALAALPDTLLDKANGVETGMTLRQALRVALAVLAGRTSGFVPGTAGSGAIRDVNNTKDRVTAVYDAFGNRTNITLDPA